MNRPLHALFGQRWQKRVAVVSHRDCKKELQMDGDDKKDKFQALSRYIL